MVVHGRESETGRVRTLVETARDGDGGCLLLHGEAGAGKSALLDEAAAIADGMHVLRATGVEAERELPFAGLHHLLHSETQRIGSLPAPQATALRGCLGIERTSSPPDRFLLSAAVLGLLGEIAAERSLLCVLDDVQWIDPGSLDALLFAARRLGGSGVAMLLALRDGEDVAVEELGMERLPIGGLEPFAARLLLSDGGGSETDASVAAELTTRTGGNALALAELAAELTDEQLAGHAALPDPLPFGAGVERAYAARVGGLDEDERSALLVAAAADGVSPPVAERAARELGVAPEAFERIEAGHWIERHRGQVTFRHPLLRAAVYGTADPSERRRAHRAIATALVEDPERQAWQLAAAAVGPEPDAVAALAQVAEDARSRGAAAASASALERAAELSAVPAERAQLLTLGAEDAWNGGRGPQALRMIAQAREAYPDSSQSARLDRLQGTIEAWGGLPVQGIEKLCIQAESVSTSDPSLALELLAEAAEAASFTASPALAARVGAVAETIPEPIDDLEALLRHRLLNGTNRYASGDLDAATPLLLDAVAIGRELDDPVLLNLAGRAAIYIGDDAASLELDRRAAQLARGQGALVAMPSILVRTQISELRTGRLWAAESSGEEAVSLAEATGQTDLVACALAFAALVAAERGAIEDARDRAERAIAIASRLELVLFSDVARTALAHLDLLAGEPAAALAGLEPITHPAARIIALLDLTEAGVSADRDDAIESALGISEEWARSTPIAIAEAMTLHCRGLAAEGEDGLQLLESAIDAYSVLDRPFENARAELALGSRLRRLRRREQSRGHLHAAQQHFERVGSESWAEKARMELRASGQTARRRDPSTLDDLTPQEIQVAQLVAEGRTNREVAAQLFLSPRTIDFHLRNVFRKLGLKSRTELARIELGGPD